MPARDTRNPGWFWADNIIVDEYLPKIGAYGLSLYILLCRHANPNGQAWPSQNTIAKKLHCSRTTVVKYLSILRDVGLITIESRETQSGDYDHSIYTLQELGCTVNVQPVVQDVYKGSTAGVHKEDSIQQDSDQESESSAKAETDVPKEKIYNLSLEALAWNISELRRGEINGKGGYYATILNGSKRADRMGLFDLLKMPKLKPGSAEDQVFADEIHAMYKWWPTACPGIDKPAGEVSIARAIQKYRASHFPPATKITPLANGATMRDGVVYDAAGNVLSEYKPLPKPIIPEKYDDEPEF